MRKIKKLSQEVWSNIVSRIDNVTIIGQPRRTSAFYKKALIRIKLSGLSLIPIWLSVLIMHNTKSITDYYHAAEYLSNDIEKTSHILASIPIAFALASVTIVVTFVRGSVSLKYANWVVCLAAILTIGCEALQYGFTHGVGNAVHNASYAFVLFCLCWLAPMQLAQRLVFIFFALTMPLISAFLTGGYDAMNNVMTSILLPVTTIVSGLFLFYWEVRNFNMKWIADVRIKRDNNRIEYQKHQLERQFEVERSRIRWLENMADFLRHELKNALVGTDTSLELLQRRAHLTDDNKYLVRLREGHHIIKELVESITQATSIESAILKEDTMIVRLDTLIREHIDIYKDNYPDNDFLLECDGTEVNVRGRDERFVQMLDKLVTNAVEHSINSEPIIFSCYKRDDNCIIKVSNRGTALPENKIEIFDLFASFRKEQKSESNRGFGLYVVKLITNGYGGTVEARDLVGATGAEFIVSIPTIRG